MRALVMQQRGSAVVLLVAMMLHVHGVPGAGLRLLLLASALWHATVSLAVVLGDYPIPLGARRGVVGVLSLAGIAVFGLGARSVLAARAPVEPEVVLTWADVSSITARCAACHGDVAQDEAAFRAWAAEAPVRDQLAANHRVDPADAERVRAWLGDEEGSPAP